MRIFIENSWKFQAFSTARVPARLRGENPTGFSLRAFGGLLVSVSGADAHAPVFAGEKVETNFNQKGETKMDKIQEKINNSHSIVKDAVGSYAKQTANRLRSFGKRCSVQWVLAQGEIQLVKRANFYENFLRWLAALFYANYAGFEYLWTDLNLFVRELHRLKAAQITGTVFPAQADENILSSLIKITSEIDFLRLRFGLTNTVSR